MRVIVPVCGAAEPEVPVTVMVYVPVVVPLVAMAEQALLWLLPPHAVTPAPSAKHRAIRPKKLRHRRRFAGMPKRSKQASAAPPEYQRMPRCGWFSAVHPPVGAVVAIVKVAFPLLDPVMLTAALDGVQLNVGGKFEPGGGVTTALSVTTPVNPLEGVTVIVEVFPVAAPGARDTFVPPNAKDGLTGVVTTRVTEPVAVV